MANAALAAASEEGSTHVHATAMTTSYVTRSERRPSRTSHDGATRRTKRVLRPRRTPPGRRASTTESLVTLGYPRRRRRRALPAVPGCRTWRRWRSASGAPWSKRSSYARRRLSPRPFGRRWFDGDRATWRSEGMAPSRRRRRGWDAWTLLFASDALPPATLPLGSSGWVPTLQLTSYVHRVPLASGCARASGASSSPTAWSKSAASCSTTPISSWPRRAQLAMVRFPVDRSRERAHALDDGSLTFARDSRSPPTRSRFASRRRVARAASTRIDR